MKINITKSNQLVNVSFKSLSVQTFCFCSSQFNSLDIICIISGRASSAAITFKNESRVRRARISTAVRAYSFIA